MGSYRLDSFGMRQMIECGARIRRLGADASSLEEVGRRVTSFLFDEFVDEHREPAFALVRIFKTHRLGDLPESIRDSITRTLPPPMPPES